MQALVKMSRLETGIISFEKAKIPVTEIIAEGLAQISPAAENKNIDVQINCHDGIFAYCGWAAPTLTK